jgi:hypothetical protein
MSSIQILIYADNNQDDFFIELKNKFNFTMNKILLNNEKVTNNNIFIESYCDDYTEEELIKDCAFIIYTSSTKRSKILIDTMKKYNKYAFFNKETIYDDINSFLNSESEELNDISLFENMYNNLLDNNINNNLSKNIKIEYVKLQKSYEINKLNIVTFYKDSEHKIINTIQKKCISENIKNKYIEKILVIGANLHSEFIELVHPNLILCDDPSLTNITYKELLELSNKYFEKKTVCILRSDIILPNQTELEDIDIHIENEVYCLSRIDRLLNGNLVRADKLNKILYCTEQDAWILKMHLNIDLSPLENIFFYDKYSELYFNDILVKSGLKIINNTKKYKILRLLHEDNLDKRLLLNNTSIQEKEDSIFLLPDNSLIDKVTIDQIISAFNINEKDLYQIKCEIINKYFKDKIISMI